MTLSSLFIVCSHGRRSAHGLVRVKTAAAAIYEPEICQGGRPATLEDLGGYRVWRCDARNEIYDSSPDVGPPTIPHWCEAGSSMAEGHENCDWYLLIPLPQMVAE